MLCDKLATSQIMPFCPRRDGTNISSLTLSPKTEGEANDVGSIFLLSSYSTASPYRHIFIDPRSPRTLQSSYRYFATPSAVQRQRAHYCANNTPFPIGPSHRLQSVCISIAGNRGCHAPIQIRIHIFLTVRHGFRGCVDV